jgi:hypothetical protein
MTTNLPVFQAARVPIQPLNMEPTQTSEEEKQLFDGDTQKEFGAKCQVLIEHITYSGSAWASAPDGEQVYISARFVDKASLSIGEIRNAQILPNFKDKRLKTPWRAVKIEPYKI